MADGLTTARASSLRIGGSLAVLAGLTFALYRFLGGADAEPLFYFQTHHIILLFAASNTAFLASTLLILLNVLRDPSRGAAGISLHAQRLKLLAVSLRSIFFINGHFGESWLSWLEAALSALSTLVLVAVIDPRISPHVLTWLPPARRPACASPEAYPSLALLAGSVVFALLVCRFGVDEVHQSSPQWVLLAVAIYVEACAVLPQRALLLRAKRLPALTGHAFVLLALAGAPRGALRLALWLVLMLEGELHTWLMLGDYLHTALLADFVVVYLRGLASQGLGSFLGASEMKLTGGMAESV